MPARKFERTPELLATLRELRGAGLSLTAIGKRVGISADTVQYICETHGISKPAPPAPAPAPVNPRAGMNSQEVFRAGHPVSWSLLTAGTVLDGVAYEP